MIILGICVALILIGAIIGADCSPLSPRDVIGGLLVFLGLIGAGVALFMMVAFQISYRGEIQQFKSVEQTVEVARSRRISLENAALQHKVVESNKWLARVKYYNSIILFDDFIPDEVEDLKPIN